MTTILTHRRRTNLLTAICWIALCFVGGCLINVGVTWWLSLRGALVYSFGTSAGVNIRPPGLPTYVEHVDARTGYRPGFQFERISGSGPGTLFDSLIAHRIAKELAKAARVRKAPTLMGAGDVVMPPLTWPEWLPFPEDDGRKYSLWEGRASGWPMRSMMSVVFVREGTTAKDSHWQIQIFDPKSYGVGNDENAGSIPLRPIPVGFLTNSLLFSLVFAPFAIFFEARRRVRRWDGACPTCGYSLAGLPQSASCPECNTPISADAKAVFSTR
jgi:hypothetical protein